MRENSCYTYFAIEGNFDPDRVTELLGLQPYRTNKIDDLRCDGRPFEAACWEFGRCDEYDVYTENQMHRTIAPLLDKIELLNKIRMENQVEFTLLIVPTIAAESIYPCLDPSLEVIDFCHATRTHIVIDLYISTDDNTQQT